MTKSLSLLILILCGYFTYGQTANLTAGSPDVQQGNGKITGIVLDSADRKPVEFATVALVLTDSDKPIDGAVCDDKGKFTIKQIAPGNYKVVISFIGYQTKTITVTLSDKKDDIDLGTIRIGSEASVLQEVTVQGEKAIIEERVDRTIYNAENDATTRGGDATDVLKRVPMLAVDMDGNVTMRGSQNVRVLINNKPSSIVASSIADALKQIPADQIKSVEVITSPSAKYDAEGSAGIINIITKKNTLQGLTLGVDAGIGTRGSNLGLNGNYRKGKMGFSLGGWGRAGYNVKGSFENRQETTQNGLPTVNFQSADTRNQNLFGNYNFGWDYDINEKNYITASVRFGARNGKNYQDDLTTQRFTGENLDAYSTQNVKTIDESHNVDVNLSYTHLYEKPQRELSVLGSYGRNNRNNDFTRITVEQDGIASSIGTKNENDSYDQEMTIQVDYQTPIQDNQMLEFGGKEIMRKVFSDFTYFTDGDGDGIFEPNPNASLTNNLNYDQSVTSGYLSYTYSTKNSYSFKAGTRYEYTVIEAYTRTEDDIDIPSYGALVPSINVSKKLKGGNMVKAAYNRRIQRPSIRFLNPNIQSSNPLNITIGNPSLDPEYTNNYEFSYSTYFKGTSLNFTAFWRNTNNAIQDIRDVVNGDTIRTTYQNIGQEDAYGMSLFANVNLGKLSLNGGTDVYYAVLENRVPDPLYNAANEGWVASYRLFGNYKLTEDWGFQFFGFYRGRQVQLQGSRGGFGVYSLSLKKDFKNKKGSIGFGAENFFTSSFKIRSELNSPVIAQKGLTELRNMSFRVNISYRIGKMNMDNAPRRRRSVNNDDLKDGGGDNGGGGGFQGGGQAPSGGNNPQGRQRPSSGNRQKVAPADPNADVKAEGRWNYTLDSPQGGEGTLTITKEGDTFSGTIFNKRFNSETPLTSVSVKGNELILNYTVNSNGNQMDVNVKGIISGDELKGNMTIGQFGTFPVNARRAE